MNTKHLYTFCTTSTLVQHCIDFIQMFCVYWVVSLILIYLTSGEVSAMIDKHLNSTVIHKTTLFTESLCVHDIVRACLVVLTL